MEAEGAGGPWLLTYTGYDPATEGIRETLCTLANAYWGTRGAAAGAKADNVHYPGTYLAGVYNRVEATVDDGTPVSDESIVNIPNWLPLTLRHADGEPIDADHGMLESYQQQLDLRHGLLTRCLVHCDAAGRSTKVTERRLVSCDQPHLAALQLTIEALNWSGEIQVRSTLDGAVGNAGMKESQDKPRRHLEPVVAEVPADDTVLLEVVTNQSRVHIALAARTRLSRDGDRLDLPWRAVDDGPLVVGQEVALPLTAGVPVTVEKVVAVATSRDRAISTPAQAALFHLRHAVGFTTLLTAHEQAWATLWDDFAVSLVAEPHTRLALHLHTFHVLQTVAGARPDVDAGIAARGLHGEGYWGHVFWDEVFVYPMLTLRRPDLTRDRLTYRYRRLPTALAAAAEEGLPGALFPWQSGNDGTELTPPLTYNPRSGRWLPDTSHRQRHVGLAIAYSVVQYHRATADIGFLVDMGGELLVEICRLFAAMAVYEPADDRYHIDAMMGPDEFHDGYPGRPGEGVRDNAYTNVLTAWLLNQTRELLGHIDAHDRGRLRRRLTVTQAETDRWDLLSRRLAVPWHGDGVMSQFDGYERLPDLDWDAYRARYSDVGRLDLILEAEGDSTDNYRIGKQADVLMLFYLFSAEELRGVLERLGYPLHPGTIRATVDFYSARASHGSTLSRIVHAWVNARAERQRAGSLLTEALNVDLVDTAAGATREGVHLGAMAGTVDLIMRCFGGVETRDEMLWVHPALPTDLARVRFSITYRGQQVTIDITGDQVRLRLPRHEAHPIKVCVEGVRVVLRPGDSYAADLRR